MPTPAQHRKFVSSHLTPLAAALSLALAGGLPAGTAHAASAAFSSGWFAAKGATNAQLRANGAPSSNLPGAVITAAQAQQRSQQSVNNLNRAVSAIAAAQAAQAAARQAALNAPSSVPDGLAVGGLQVDDNPLTQGWTNANAPTQTSAGGSTTVTVQQTAPKAILNWKTFNVGKNTTLHFDQSGGTQTSGGNDWIVLNRINDPSQKPSQILGRIQAEGSVYVLNRNGIIFSGGSQVNVHSLLASSMDLFSADRSKSDKYFMAKGIAGGTDPDGILGDGADATLILSNGVTTDASGQPVLRGAISVAAGASITAQAQGYALLAAPALANAGTVAADGGSVILAADGGLRYVQSDKGLQVMDATSVGSQPVPGLGDFRNTGLIQARQGSIQVIGNQVSQDGVIVASTSLSHPGSIQIDAAQMGAVRTVVTLGANSVTTVLPEKDGETTSSSVAADQSFQTSTVALSAHQINMNAGSLLEVPSGAVTLTTRGTNFNGAAALGRIYIDNDATIDVSGLADVELPMSALLVTIPRIGQNELADSPLLRNGFLYTQKNLAIDSTVSGTRDDGLDWVGSPILNVGGYVQNVPRDIEQLMIRGGTISLVSQEVITRTGSALLLDGGYLNYLPGTITTPNLMGADGRIYNIANANPDIAYVGFAGEYTSDHPRWGVSETYTNPLLAGFKRWDDGFILGGDAGTLNLGGGDTSANVVLDGGLSAQSYAGRNQVIQGNQPAAGNLTLLTDSSYLLMNTVAPLEMAQSRFDADTALPGAPVPDDGTGMLLEDWYALPTRKIGDAGFGTVKLTSLLGQFVLDDGATLEVHQGGTIALTAQRVEVDGTLRATGGTINIIANGLRNPDGTLILTHDANGVIDVVEQTATGGVLVGAHGVLDAGGRWVNDGGLAQDALTGSQYIDGGRISLVTYQAGATGGSDQTSDITLAPGSLLDVSGGGYVQPDGKVKMSGSVPAGRGGDIEIATHRVAPTLAAYASAPDDLEGGQVQLGGTLRSYGFSGGGTLTIEAPGIQIGGTPAPTPQVSLLYLPDSFFSGQGFANYALTSETDAVIASGAKVNVLPANFLPNLSALVVAPTGSSLYDGSLATIGYLDPYQRWTSNQGMPAGLTLNAGLYRGWGGITGDVGNYQGVTGSVSIGKGATLTVDAGATVGLHAADRIELLGTVTARGGVIDVTSHNFGADTFTAADRAIWLGGEGRLDVSGISLIDTLAPFTGSAEGSFQPRTGTVLDGGTVSLMADQFVVAQAGGTIDVSGAGDVYDLPRAESRLGMPSIALVSSPVWSDAGDITLGAGTGLLFDGTLAAHAGGPLGSGGSLTIEALNGGTSQPKPNALVIQQSGAMVPVGLRVGDAIPAAAASGTLYFTADRLAGSGIQDLSIGAAAGLVSNDPGHGSPILVAVRFAGDVNLTLSHSVVMNATSYAAIPAGTQAAPATGTTVSGAGTVSIDAPYVYLNGAAAAAGDVGGDGTLDVRADFIDLGGAIDLQGYARANFVSAGDLRFYTPPAVAYNTGERVTGWLHSTGDLDFTATRIYPVSDYTFVIDASAPAGATGAQTTVAFHGNGKTDGTTPLSAGGTLAVSATHIEQGGTLWVPSGSIMLGVTDTRDVAAALGLPASFPLAVTQSVALLPGSVTSVSLNGAILPYGSSTDGQEWRYDADVSTKGSDISAAPAKQITLNGDQISLQQGATLDLSGGGDLQAYEWVPGTGGTRDVLSQTQTSYVNSTTGTQQPTYSDGRAIYAIVPGYSAPVSAHDAALEKGAGAGPSVGQAVYLSGVAGLPDGVYTLLPARYATLPGAYRVVRQTAISDAVLGQNAVMADGTQIVSGYVADALTGARAARNSAFIVQSAATWQQYSQYDYTLASQFFPALAAHAGNVAPPSPQDAGRLVIAAGHELDLDTTLNAGKGPDGRGAQVDIAGQAIQIVTPGGTARDGFLQIDADGLSKLGASSLLIGGTRQSTDDGDAIDVSAHDVVLSNGAAHPLSAPEIILVANGQGGIAVDAGSVLQARGDADTDPLPLILGAVASTTGSVTTPAVSGDGVLLRVSNGAASPVTRHDVTGVDGPAGTAGGTLTIDAGAVLDGGATLSLDTTGAARMAGDAVLRARSIDVSANRIAFSDAAEDASAGASSLLIGPATLGQFAGADSITLRSRSTIDFLGDVSVAVADALRLSAGALTSDGGQVRIDAGTLGLGNDLAAAGTYAGGTGGLIVHAGELDLGAGAMTLRGFGSVAATAQHGIAAQDEGHYDFGGATVTLTAPVLLADTGSSLDLRTTGLLTLAAADGAALSRVAQGGAVSLTGGTVHVSTNILAPAGTVALTATTGDLTVDGAAVLNVAGVDKTFYDAVASAPGGTLVLDAMLGNVQVGAGTTLDVTGAAGGSNAGKLTVRAETGVATLSGRLRGAAAAGYLGGLFTLETGGAADLEALADVLGSSGINGSISVRSGTGDLVLGAGHQLVAHQVTLTADGDRATGGRVHIDGTVDASGNFGGSIELYGQAGVDIEGSLLANALQAGRRGGSITLGTNGSTDGTLNAIYGYQNVQAVDSGTIFIGAGAKLDLSGPAGGGTLSLRAPLLTNGDVNIAVAPGAVLTGASAVTVEGYATWSTADQVLQGDPAKAFDGMVDPAGWYQADPATGEPRLVPGHFVDASGNTVADPDFDDPRQVANYLAQYMFVPDAANAAHQSFYGYVNGEPAQGNGTLIGFVQNPGFTFDTRFAGIANMHVRPGIVLVNPDTMVDHGDISVLTNWNLGAQDSDGSSRLAFRYQQAEAPVLELRAFNDLKIQASITDGFYQLANVLTALPPESDYAQASLAWDTLQQNSMNDIGSADYFSAPTNVDGMADALAAAQYYGQYLAYATYLNTQDDGVIGSQGFRPLDVIAYGLSGIIVPPQPVAGAPTPPSVPTRLSDYPAYLSAYADYLPNAALASDFFNQFFVPDNMTTLAAPPTAVLDHVAPPAAATDNSPSPLRSAGNPLPLLSATLAGGASTSYRLIAGADVGSVNPLAVQAAALGSHISLDGHTDYADPATGATVYAPTLVRTGTGSIDMVSAGDIRWLDNNAPAAVYTAGVPAAGTNVGASATLWSDQTQHGASELVVTGAVNPVDGGDISLRAGGDIVAIQQLANTDGSTGTPLSQYWWPWMQTGNSAGRSSIAFGAFGQGVMSVGGNVDVQAGGDIRDLSVSLPTTWTITSDAAGNRTLNVLGGGDLNVEAGGDIRSGTYFVSRGTGTITAGGAIASDLSYTAVGLDDHTQAASVTTAVATLLGIQDAQLTVQARGGIDIGGAYNPSWLGVNGGLPISLTSRFDGQSYSQDSSLSVLSAGGDVRFGSLKNSATLIAQADTPGSGISTVASLLPATVSLTAMNGDLAVMAAGELYPSPTGNLSMLAGGSITFDVARESSIPAEYHVAWGLIDAPLSSLPSPLNDAFWTDSAGVAHQVRQTGYLLQDQNAEGSQFVHSADPLHGGDNDPVRIYALDGDIVNGLGGGLNGVFIVPNKPARIEAGRDIVDLAFVGGQSHASDITRIAAGRDIYDTSLSLNTSVFTQFPSLVLPVILQGGPGTLQIEAGRDIGPFASQADLAALPTFASFHSILLDGNKATGIDTTGNFLNNYLPYQGASVQMLYGVAPGIDQAAFIDRYVNPASSVPGVPSLMPDLVAFMQDYVAGLDVDTGLVKDATQAQLSDADAWARFQALPAQTQRVFVEQALFKILATVGNDYNNADSPFFQQYARGYAALGTLFPASLGYTDNGSGLGGTNGASRTIDTGNLDIRGSTIQTQQGGNIDVLAPGGQALVGGTSAPPVITNTLGNVVAGPNSMGILTLRQGDINIFTDRSVLLAQSRIFTEQGGGVTIWSSNGDINAGKGAKTTSEIQPVSYLCDVNSWCRVNPSGQVSGAGIATLQTIPGAPTGDAFLMAPRGTVDAGDAGIRVSGDLVIAAAHVANADNIQVQGKSSGIPVVAQVNVAALTSASAAASAASDAADSLSRQRQAAARQALPSIITVQVLGFGGEPVSGGAVSPPPAAPVAQRASQRVNGTVEVLGDGEVSASQLSRLTPQERRRLGL